MKKFAIMGALVALVVAALALPALAQQKDILGQGRADFGQDFGHGGNLFAADAQGNNDFAARDNRSQQDQQDRFAERFGNDFFGQDGLFGRNDLFGNDRFDDNNDFGNNAGVSQSNQQQVQSGDANQSITVTGGGDNSNQCAGVQGVVNTGNATNNTSVLQYGNEDSGVGISDSGNFIISPSQTTTCDQRVNQAASASGW